MYPIFPLLTYVRFLDILSVVLISNSSTKLEAAGYINLLETQSIFF